MPPVVSTRDRGSRRNVVVDHYLRAVARTLIGSRTDCPDPIALLRFPTVSAAVELDGDIASSSCDRAASTSRRRRDDVTFLAPVGPLTLVFRSLRPSLLLFAVPAFGERALSTSPSLSLSLSLCLSLSFSSFPRQIVQNTGPRNTLGDLHTIEESDGQFSERSGVVATRDSCHDVLTEEKREREREREKSRINPRADPVTRVTAGKRSEMYLYRRILANTGTILRRTRRASMLIAPNFD